MVRLATLLNCLCSITATSSTFVSQPKTRNASRSCKIVPLNQLCGQTKWPVPNWSTTLWTLTHLTTDMLLNKCVAIQIIWHQSYCCKMFTKVSEYHSLNTRSSTKTDLKIPKMNLTIGQHNIRYCSVKIWHSIDSEVKNAENLDKFKASLNECWSSNLSVSGMFRTLD